MYVYVYVEVMFILWPSGDDHTTGLSPMKSVARCPGPIRIKDFRNTSDPPAERSGIQGICNVDYVNLYHTYIYICMYITVYMILYTYIYIYIDLCIY